MKRIRVILTIVWMGFIFYQGTQTGEVSIQTSDKIVNPIVDLIEQMKPAPEINEPTEGETQENMPQTEEDKQENKNQSHENLYKKVHYIVRKSAHFFEYAVLAGLAFWTSKVFHFSFSNQVIYTLFMILSVGVMDEYMQSFVARTSSISDVLIDFSGGIIGILIVLTFNQFTKT